MQDYPIFSFYLDHFQKAFPYFEDWHGSLVWLEIESSLLHWLDLRNRGMVEFKKKSGLTHIKIYLDRKLCLGFSANVSI